MGINGSIGGDGTFFIGEDKVLSLSVLTKDPRIYPYDGTNAGAKAVDITGWEIKLVVRKTDNAAETALLTKTAVVGGVYNVNPAINTQRAVVELSDTETAAFTTKSGRYSFRRTDDQFNTDLRYGVWTLQRDTQSPVPEEA